MIVHKKPQKPSGKPQGSYKKFQGRNPYSIFVAFLVESMTPKRHFEINWPLTTSWGDFTSLHAMISNFRITEKAAICTQEIRDRITGYPGHNLSITLSCSPTKNEFQIFLKFFTHGLVFMWKQIRWIFKICENSEFVSPENMWWSAHKFSEYTHAILWFPPPYFMK